MDIPVASPMDKKRVTIEEADNGYVVCMYDNSGDGPGDDHNILCKTSDEATKAALKLLGSHTNMSGDGGIAEDSKMKKEATDFFSKAKSGGGTE